MTIICEHKWQYQGKVYWNSEYPRPGSDAYDRIYGDLYFCTRCLDTKIKNQITIGNSYSNPIPGTLPRGN